MTRIPSRLRSEWLVRRAVDGPLLLRAQQLHEREDYVRSSALLAPFFAEDAPEASGHGARPLVDAVTLHAWNLLQSNQSQALAELLQRVDMDAQEACPELAVVDLFLKVRQGDLAAARAGAEHHIDLQREAMGRHTSRFLYVLALVDSKSGNAEAAVAYLDQVSLDTIWRFGAESPHNRWQIPFSVDGVSRRKWCSFRPWERAYDERVAGYPDPSSVVRRARRRCASPRMPDVGLKGGWSCLTPF